MYCLRDPTSAQLVVDRYKSAFNGLDLRRDDIGITFGATQFLVLPGNRAYPTQKCEDSLKERKGM